MRHRRAVLFLIIIASVWWDDPRRSGNNFELVFGIELSMNGASSAVSLANGSLVGLATVAGGEKYVDLMRDWYQICTMDNATREEKKTLASQRYPDVSSDDYTTVRKAEDAFHKSASWPSWGRANILWMMFDWFPPDPEELYAQTFFAEDEAVSILEPVLKKLHEATMLALSNVTDIPAANRPYTEIALPGWMFNNRPMFADEDPPEIFYVAAFDYRPFIRRVSVVAHRAGFRRSVTDQPREIMFHHDRGAHPSGPPPAPDMAIRAVVNGTCEMSAVGRKNCEVRPNSPCSPDELLAVIDRQSVDGTDLIMLWMQKCSTFAPKYVRWSSWDMSRTRINHEQSQRQILEEIATEIGIAAEGVDGIAQDSSRDELSLLLTGDKWLEGTLLAEFLKSSHLQNLTVEVVHGEQDQLLVAISAAEVARYEWFTHNVMHVEDDF
ncbi:hypothetical protein PRZ48_013399 [Zasmidium cellare]|uniref:Uncharacterized protein n=1 Tax=Zasmidium cellare TaxID=395010 RepID=A0ABR0E0W6_ZASCE|nr:hypothetical protein PRZ48_013399 [Zasmidium cellare]